MNLRSIPAGVNFLDVLANFLRVDSAATQTALADYTILLPTRRAIRTLEQTLSETTPTLLPRMHALGDLDDDILTLHQPDMTSLPLINDTARLGLVIGLIQEREAMPFARAQALAIALINLLDEAALREVSLAALETLVPEDLAIHWGISLEWLRVITQKWPEVLSERGQVDAAIARQETLNGYAKLWSEKPPPYPVIAAGSTGSLPATQRLLKTIAGLPRGIVILPALDLSLSDDIWETLPSSHPQKPLANLLADFGITRGAILPFPSAIMPHAALWQQVLLPAVATHRWRDPAARLMNAHNFANGARPAMLENISTCTAPDSEAEACVIALILHRAAREDKTAALITPDRTLAARVTAQMQRFGITVNDSAGARLDQSPPGRWLRLLLACLRDEADALSLLGLLKHPLSCFGATRAACRAAARTIECDYFRADTPVQNLSQLLSRTDESLPLRNWLMQLQPLLESQALSEWIKTVRALAAELTTEPEGAPLIWQQDAGEALWQLFLQLETHSSCFPPLSAEAFTQLLNERMQSIPLHPHDAHPRLQILGTLEARLHGFDTIILGSMNEGIWPADPTADPWLSRPMREQMGLATPDEMVGLAAHDFYQFATQPRVILTRAELAGGAPTVANAWWRRLSAYVQACGGNENLLEDEGLLAAAMTIDMSPEFARAPRPAPKPDAVQRPQRYSPSSLETLMRNPYEFYARYILNLRALPALGEVADMADQGNFLHAVLADFTRAHPDYLPLDSTAILDVFAESHMQKLSLMPTDRVFWQQNFARARDNFLAWQHKILSEGRRVVAVEHNLSHLFETAAGPVTLHARADRIDVDANGEWVIVDYKSKSIPTKMEAFKFIKPQMAMEGWLLGMAGLEGHPVRAVSTAEFWPLLSDDDGVSALESEKFAKTIAMLPERLTEFLGYYLNADHPFTACVPDQPFDDQKAYVQLSRAAEWQGRAA